LAGKLGALSTKIAMQTSAKDIHADGNIADTAGEDQDEEDEGNGRLPVYSSYFVLHVCLDIPVIHIGGQDHIGHDPDMISDEEEYVFDLSSRGFFVY
jgi:hypothetical protein